MPDFKKLEQHVNNLSNLLSNPQEGLGSWCLLVGNEWGKISEMWQEPGSRREIILEKALERIAKWNGEFPETGKFWDEQKTRPMSYDVAYGSNGTRDYMRAIARQALDS